MFWIVDSIIMSKEQRRYKKDPPLKSKRKKKQPKVYLPLADLERTVGDDNDGIAVEEHSLMCSDNDSVFSLPER